MASLVFCRDGRRLPNSVMAMGVMEESSSKSLEKLLAKQKIKEIAAEDYDCKIETWLRLADQMLKQAGDPGNEITIHSTPRQAGKNKPN